MIQIRNKPGYKTIYMYEYIYICTSHTHTLAVMAYEILMTALTNHTLRGLKPHELIFLQLGRAEVHSQSRQAKLTTMMAGLLLSGSPRAESLLASSDFWWLLGFLGCGPIIPLLASSAMLPCPLIPQIPLCLPLSKTGDYSGSTETTQDNPPFSRPLI